MFIEIGGFSIKLQRKRIKNINLRIQRTGEIHVSAPLKLPLDAVYDFLNDKRAWISKQHRRLQLVPQAKPKSLETGEPIYFLGRSFELCIHEGFKKPCVELIDNQIHLFIRETATLGDKRTLLTQWYRVQMDQRLPGLFAKWEAIIGVKACVFRIKLMKSRWGSCNPLRKHISLNLRLIAKPQVCLEYVIVHELVHLLEPSHNQRFYALMTQFMPDWKSVKEQLSSGIDY